MEEAEVKVLQIDCHRATSTLQRRSCRDSAKFEVAVGKWSKNNELPLDHGLFRVAQRKMCNKRGRKEL
jgi:hypothetical protein